MVCAFCGPSLGQACVQLCFTLPIAGREVGFAPLHFCGRQEKGSSHVVGHGDLPFPEE